jgi:hypothetical protein
MKKAIEKGYTKDNQGTDPPNHIRAQVFLLLSVNKIQLVCKFKLPTGKTTITNPCNITFPVITSGL